MNAQGFFFFGGGGGPGTRFPGNFFFRVIHKNLTDFRKTVETGMDPRLAILILPPGHPIIIIEINIFLCEQLISMIITEMPTSANLKSGELFFCTIPPPNQPTPPPK